MSTTTCPCTVSKITRALCRIAFVRIRRFGVSLLRNWPRASSASKRKPESWHIDADVMCFVFFVLNSDSYPFRLSSVVCFSSFYIRPPLSLYYWSIEFFSFMWLVFVLWISAFFSGVTVSLARCCKPEHWALSDPQREIMCVPPGLSTPLDHTWTQSILFKCLAFFLTFFVAFFLVSFK